MSVWCQLRSRIFLLAERQSLVPSLPILRHKLLRLHQCRQSSNRKVFKALLLISWVTTGSTLSFYRAPATSICSQHNNHRMKLRVYWSRICSVRRCLLCNPHCCRLLCRLQLAVLHRRHPLLRILCFFPSSGKWGLSGHRGIKLRPVGQTSQCRHGQVPVTTLPPPVDNIHCRNF